MEEAIKQFEKFTNSYKQYGDPITLKIKHTRRVTKITEEIVKSLKLNEEEKEIAELCGLLHDIGRFEQYKEYKTYDDQKSLDHGDLGYKILKEKDYLSVYTTNEKYKESLLKSVKYHNKYRISKNLSKQDKLFCNIARDADKLDILYLYVNGTFKVNSEGKKIGKEAMTALRNHESVVIKNGHNKADFLSVCLGFTFDFNFRYSFESLKKKNTMNIIIDKMKEKGSLEFQKQLEEIRTIINNYIEERLSC